jgi:iron complex transport system permease protein
MAAVTLLAFFASFMVGRFSISAPDVAGILASPLIGTQGSWDATLEQVVLQVRLPRIALAILVGGALAVAGASYQTLFKNPMVSPDILGVSAGAGFGAALAMVSGGGWLLIQGSSFFFGLVSVAAAYIIAQAFGKSSITILILGGVVVSSFFSALLNIVKTLADTDNELPTITFWLMGGLGKGTLEDVLFMLPLFGIAFLLLFMFRNQVNALAAGEEEAASMGVNIPLLKIVVIGASTLLTVVSVSVCGIIGWVGMVVPHIARFCVGASYSKLAASSFFIGGVFLLMIDNLVRGVIGLELPLGVLTALVGTPIFVVLLSRVRRGWS